MTFLKNEEKNTFVERLYISLILLRHGIGVNLRSGKLFYLTFSPHCLCYSLDLVRHGKTVAVEKGEFMSNSSKNSVLSASGILELEGTAKEIDRMSPDVILFAPIERTEKTFKILKKYLSCNPTVKKCEYMIGINNSVWGDKKFESLDYENVYVFLQRECNHNIFVKSFDGDSWGDVLVRCARLLKELNCHYASKKVLLVSQGSVFQAMKILLHQNRHPWDGYSPSAMFGTVGKDKLIGYGHILKIC